MERRKRVELFLLGLISGFAIRFFLSPYPGFPGDIYTFKLWSYGALKYGLRSLYTYSSPLWSDYHPFYLIILKGIGWLYRTFLNPQFLNLTLNPNPFDPRSLFFYDRKAIILLKLPPIGFDLLTGSVLFLFLRKYKPRLALPGLFIYLFTPSIFYLSGFWGQADSVFTFFVFCAFVLFLEKKIFLSWIFLSLAFLTKPQGGAFLPLFLYCTLRERGIKILTLSLLLFAGTALLVFLPFLLGGNPGEIYRILSSQVGKYPLTSSFAFNFWWLVSWGRPVSDTISFLFFLTPRWMGIILFSLFYLLILKFQKKFSPPPFLFSLSLVSFIFFLFPTEIHERYLFPLFIFILGLILFKPKLAWVYPLLALSHFLNLLQVTPPQDIFPYPCPQILLSLNLFVEQNRGVGIFLSFFNLSLFFWLFWVYLTEKKRII